MVIEKDLLTEKIIGCCFKVHRDLGPGFKEQIYHKALILSLIKENLKVDTEKTYSINYSDKKIGTLRVDLIINNQVILEIKALSGRVPEVFKYQLLSYLKISKIKTGLLINLGNQSCHIKRFSNK